MNKKDEPEGIFYIYYCFLGSFDKQNKAKKISIFIWQQGTKNKNGNMKFLKAKIENKCVSVPVYVYLCVCVRLLRYLSQPR